MNIAIADDRQQDQQAAEDYLFRFFSRQHPEVMEELHIFAFASAEELLAAFAPGKFDMLLLDIYMADMTGMEAAEQVRLRDNQVPIVFLTTSREHLLEGYRVFAAGYLIKPLAEHPEDFMHTMEHIFPRLMEGEKRLRVPQGGREVDVPIRKIIFVDINTQHNLSLHLGETVVDTTLPYARCQELLLQDSRFMECYHRVIINMDCVRHMGQDDFLMSDGTRVPISQRRKKEAKVAYMRYMAHR